MHIRVYNFYFFFLFSHFIRFFLSLPSLFLSSLCALSFLCALSSLWLGLANVVVVNGVVVVDGLGLGLQRGFCRLGLGSRRDGG